MKSENRVSASPGSSSNHLPHFVGTPPRPHPLNYTFAGNPREENFYVLAI